MKRVVRWIAGISGMLVTPAAGVYAGSQAAFWYTYIFLDEDRTGNADVATNISYLGLLVLFSAIGFVLGFVLGWILLARMIRDTATVAPDARMLRG
jgi:hypothetical protein